MKRIIQAVLLSCAFIFSAVTVASASMFDPIAPMVDNYVNAYARLDIASGEATVSASLSGKPGVTSKVTIHLYLQQYKDGKWTNYDDWTKTISSVNNSLLKTLSVPKGYTYRAKASCYAYAGSKSEHVIKYSSEVKY